MKRRLAAILIADVTGYSRMMQADEAGTLIRLSKRRRDILDPVTKEHHGRIVKIMGDGVLMEFSSALDAVSAALALQAGFTAANEGQPDAEQITLRIGINLGDVIGQGADVYGDSVNVAARLEALATPGAVCISGKVYAEINGKLEVETEDLGLQKIKNIDGGVQAHMLRPATGDAPANAASADQAITYPALPRRPSIAVLPFQNMSADAEQEYFADGMVEDIITELSRNKFLFVIARNSSFTYKGQAVDIKQVGRELGVAYVLEGSVRRAGQRLRITGQLIDARTGAHVWADRFDGDLADVFDLQDQITSRVVSEIAPRVEKAEIEKARVKPTDSLDAYDHHLRGLAEFNGFSRETNARALAHFMKATELDPDFAAAYAMASRCYGQRVGFGWIEDSPREGQDALHLARIAAQKGTDDAAALASAGFTMTLFRDIQSAGPLLERAIRLNPNLFIGFQMLAMVRVFGGQLQTGRDAARTALRLSPNDAQLFGTHAMLGFAAYFEEKYDEALDEAGKSLQYRANFKTAAAIVAASLAMKDQAEEAKAAIGRLLEIAPGLTLSNLDDWIGFEKDAHRAHWHQGLMRAGLPA